MENIKVSIIVPVYNVADYLRRCLDSCINQTLQEIEVIVVNDCSPDPRDGEIMKEYAKKFPDKVKCIWHKKNLQQGGARNTGIRSARGEFIYCVDSDDYIDLKLCEKMYAAIIAEKADMAVCDCNRVENGVIVKNWSHAGDNGKFDTTDLSERIKNIKIQAVWVIMIKKTIIENNDLYFSDHSGSFEDLIIVLWYLASNKIIQINESLYYYHIRENSVLREKKLETYILNCNAVRHVMGSNYVNNLDDSVKKILFLHYVKHIHSWCKIVCENYATEFVKFCDMVLNLFKIYKIDYSDNIYMQSERDIFSREIFHFIEQNINTPDFNFEFAAYYEYQFKRMQFKKTQQLISLYKNKCLTIWGCGVWGKRNATNMNVLGAKFEITDINTKIHGKKILANLVVKPWDELKEHTDVILVSAEGIYENVRESVAKECPNIEIIDLIKLLQ